MCDCMLKFLVCVIVWRDKEPMPEEDPAEQNGPVMGAENITEDEGKSHWTFWSYCSYMYDCL
jgi:hypothetical protein